MQKVKLLNDFNIQRQSLSKDTTVYFELHVIASQMERLLRNKEELLNKIAQIDDKLEHLKCQYNMNKGSENNEIKKIFDKLEQKKVYE